MLIGNEHVMLLKLKQNEELNLIVTYRGLVIV
jgi:hypothetical protein